MEKEKEKGRSKGGKERRRGGQEEKRKDKEARSGGSCLIPHFGVNQGFRVR